MSAIVALGLTLSVAGVGLATALRAPAREAQAMANHPPQGQFVTVDGHQVHVVKRGQLQGSAPDLVLIHGSNGSSRDMTFRLSPALEDAYHILIFDRPGLGYSDAVTGKGTSIQTQAAVLQKQAPALAWTARLYSGKAMAVQWLLHGQRSFLSTPPQWLMCLASPTLGMRSCRHSTN